MPFKNYEIKLQCKGCYNFLTYHACLHPFQSQIEYRHAACPKCGTTNKIIQSHIKQINDNKNKNKNETKNKMKIEKIELGNYLSLENYSLGDKIELKICDSGRMEKTNFQGVKSERLVIKIDGEGLEEIKDFSLSPKRQNSLIVKFGNNTDKWVGEVFTVLVESCTMGKTGLQFTVMGE